MNIKKIFKVSSYTVLGLVVVVASFLGFEKKKDFGDNNYFSMPDIPTANADVPIPPSWGGEGGEGEGGGDA